MEIEERPPAKPEKKQGARGWRGFNNGFFLDLFVCLGLVRVGLITFEEFGKSQQGEKSKVFLVKLHRCSHISTSWRFQTFCTKASLLTNCR